MSDIDVQGYERAPTIEELRALPPTTVLQVIAQAEMREEGTPFMEFFRFARIVAFENRSAPKTVCDRCGESADVDMLVEWETGYVSPEGDHVCEHCLVGFVTEGADKIGFGPDGACQGEWSISLTIPTRPPPSLRSLDRPPL